MTVKTKSAAAILAAGFFILFIGGGARFIIGLTLRPMVEDLHWERGDLGLAVAVFQTVSAVCMFLAGRAADRMSLRLVLGCGLALSGTAISAMSLVSQPWHGIVFYGLLFAVGNGIGSTTVVGVMATRAVPGRAGLANAFISSGMSAGQLVMVGVMAALLADVGWRAEYLWVGAMHVLVLPFVALAVPGAAETPARSARPVDGLDLSQVVRTRPFWLLLGIYAICGFDDFFVSTHVVAFAQDVGLNAMLAGNLLAWMGITGLAGVMLAGWWGDRAGPIVPTLASFGARVLVFGLVLVDQSMTSVMIFALVFGATFLVTAPMTVLFVRSSFGTRNLGAITGLLTMVHHVCGGIGAYAGARVFDATGRYDMAFVAVFSASIIAIMLCLMFDGLRSSARMA